METYVASVVFAEIPESFNSPTSDLVYETLVVHCPENGNDAHSEIRIRRRENPEDWHKPASAAFRAKIKDEIAKRMSVVYPLPGVGE
jgi:hypothetical protein